MLISQKRFRHVQIIDVIRWLFIHGAKFVGSYNPDNTGTVKENFPNATHTKESAAIKAFELLKD
jgi:hypothetical protein